MSALVLKRLMVKTFRDELDCSLLFSRGLLGVMCDAFGWLIGYDKRSRGVMMSAAVHFPILIFIIQSPDFIRKTDKTHTHTSKDTKIQLQPRRVAAVHFPHKNIELLQAYLACLQFLLLFCHPSISHTLRRNSPKFNSFSYR